MHKLFQTLADKHYIFNGNDAVEAVGKMDASASIQLLSDCYEVVNLDSTPDRKSTIFDFAPTSSMSGGITPCFGIGCRIESAYRLATFGALYADTIILPNFFDYFYHMQQSGHYPVLTAELLERFKKRLIGDIAVYFQYQALLDMGVASIKKNEIALCKDCHKRLLQEQGNFETEINKIVQSLQNVFKSNMQLVLTAKRYITIEDPTSYLGDLEGIGLSRAISKKMVKLSRQLPHTFTEKEIIKFGIMNYLLDDPINDLIGHNYYPNLAGASYLTDRKFDVDVIAKANSITSVVSPVRPNDFYYSLPYIQDINITSLLQLRHREQESFQVYRDALTKAFRQSATPTEAFQEIVSPAINQIKNIISNNQRHYKARVGKKLAVNAAVTVTGMVASSLFDIKMATIPALAGISFAANQIIEDASGIKSLPVEARNDRFFFLWSTQRLSPHADR